jgi:Flp pilus assembly pilin Flp
MRQFVSDESGQDVVEYGMLVGSIAMVVLLGGGAFGNTLAAWFNHLAGRLTTTGT